MRRRSRLNPSRRAGCTTCKKRHKKCDEQRPRCGNCIRLNLECIPPELFRAARRSPRRPEIASGFDAFHLDTDGDRSEAWQLSENVDSSEIDDDEDSASVSSPTWSSVSSSTANTISSDRGSVSPGNADCTLDFDLCPPLWAMNSARPHASSLESYLLQNYVTRASTVLINVDGPSNPLRSVVIPRAVVSPALMDALYATSAFHIFVHNHNPDFRTSSLIYCNQAACALHRQLAEIEPNTPGRDLELLLLTSLLLCKYEITSGSVSNWRTHLQGLQKMLRLFQSRKTKMASETVSYVQSFIAYHSCIAEVTRIERLSSPSPSYTEEGYQISGGLSNQVDPYMGVSGDLISLLRIAAETAMLDFSKEPNVTFMMCNVMRIYDRIKSVEKASVSFQLSDEHPVETIDSLDNIANAYKKALTVYMHIIFDAVAENSAADKFVLQYTGVRNLLAATKEEAVSECLQDMLLVREDSSCIVGLVPLLFIVASETKKSTEFEIASKRLTTILETACLGNISTVLELLHKIRRAKAANWRHVLKHCDWDLIVT